LLGSITPGCRALSPLSAKWSLELGERESRSFETSVGALPVEALLALAVIPTLMPEIPAGTLPAGQSVPGAYGLEPEATVL